MQKIYRSVEAIKGKHKSVKLENHSQQSKHFLQSTPVGASLLNILHARSLSPLDSPMHISLSLQLTIPSLATNALDTVSLGVSESIRLLCSSRRSYWVFV